ncbi:hypothetical protein IFM89_016172 [Coptis chinensis]|uniref:F-box domain-containing protein n=1 Tax=Coptis chinensis TaxID=261450 RepID=A0A835GYR1_9MAGN|nr:hypothetical protein IFM89_008808 [Coptis chinensis]KAF9588812.1 hypothetical protein IFM89_016172 [Coptis chinensis]
MKSKNIQIPRAKKLKTDNNGDRISSLPNNLLHEILALLDMKQVVQTSVLSTRWRDLWTSIPTLNFNSTVFLESRRKTAKDKDRFMDFVDQHCLLPFHYLLTIVDVGLTSKLFSSAPVLELLIVVDCRFREKMKNLIISSLKLKYLVIENCCDGYDKFVKQAYCKITIFAPNLVSLRLKDHLGRDYSIEYFPSLVNANIDMEKEILVEIDFETALISTKEKDEYAKRVIRYLNAVCNVRALTVSPWLLEVVSNPPVALVEALSLQFLNLRHLKLITWLSSDCIHAITYLLNISPNLESLNVKLIKRNVTVLGSEVEIHGILGCPNGLKFLEILLKSAVVLEKVWFSTSKERLPNKEKRLMKFREMLREIPQPSPKTVIFFF